MTFRQFAEMCLAGGMTWSQIKEATLEGVPEDKKEEVEKELNKIKTKIDAKVN